MSRHIASENEIAADDFSPARAIPTDPSNKPDVNSDPLSSSPQPPSPLDELFALNPSEATDEQIQDLVNREIKIGYRTHALASTYNILILHNDNTLTRTAADRMYSALAGIDRSKPVLLILNTPGGDIAAAYFVAKLCREHTDQAFHVAVPRRAKSAGTLICCGADRIHMGGLSELGPIDPQFGSIPALALKHSVEHIAELVGTYPKAQGMFSDYLARSLRIESLGFFERVAVSAVQYAIRLLNARTHVPGGNSSDFIANQLVYAYKDRGFVIDSREAIQIFGKDVIAINQAEYNVSNAIFDSLSFLSWVCTTRFSRGQFSYVGDTQHGCWVFPKSAS